MEITGYRVLNADFSFQPMRISYDTHIQAMDAEAGGDTMGYIIPGLVDVHTHGAVGQDAMTMHDFASYSYFMYSKGITTFYPTSVSATEADMLKMAAFFKDIPQVSGLNIEGPFINKDFRGAHSESTICEGSLSLLYKLIEASDNKIKLITVAPEIGQNMEFVAKAREAGVYVSIGHTACDYATALTAMEMGADHITHLFNAMKPLHHRNSGLIGAAFDKPFYTEIIADGIHVVPEVVRLAYHAIGRERLLLISDCISATGLSDGKYKLGGMDVTVKDSIAHTDDGALAGSTFTLYDMVRSVMRMGISAEDAIYMATQTPAKSVGVSDIGVLKPGAKADFVVLNEQFEVMQTVKNGEIVYSVC